MLSWRNQQAKQLTKDADILEMMNEDWFRYDIQKRVLTKYIIGTQDDVVDRSSAAAYWGNPDVETVIGCGHSNLVKPQKSSDMAVKILYQLLLTPAPRPVPVY